MRPSTLHSTTGWPFAITPFSSPTGHRSRSPTRTHSGTPSSPGPLLRARHVPAELLLAPPRHLLRGAAQREASEALAQEAEHAQAPRADAVEPATHQVEARVGVQLPGRGAVRALHVVRLDLEVRQRVRTRLAGQQQVAVRLVRVRALRARMHADDPAEDAPARPVQRPLV